MFAKLKKKSFHAKLFFYYKGSENNSVSISTFDVCVDWYTDQQRAILVTTYLVFFGTDHLKNIQK